MICLWYSKNLFGIDVYPFVTMLLDKLISDQAAKVNWPEKFVEFSVKEELTPEEISATMSNNVTPINLIEGSNTAAQFEALESFHDRNKIFSEMPYVEFLRLGFIYCLVVLKRMVLTMSFPPKMLLLQLLAKLLWKMLSYWRLFHSRNWIIFCTRHGITFLVKISQLSFSEM